MDEIAIFNAGGAQASAIADRVADAGYRVRRLSRSGGAGRQPVDPADEMSIAAALKGAAGAVFTVPQDYRAGVREAYAERVVRAAERSGIGRLVVNIGGPIFPELDDPFTHELVRIRSILTGGAVETVVLQPTMFLDNLLQPWSLAAIVNDGVIAYPIPDRARISFISHRSLGDFAGAALRVPEAAGRVFNIGGPEAVSGAALADAVGAAAERPVRFVEMPLEAFSAALDQAFEPPAGPRIAALYRHFRERPDAGALNPDGWAMLEVEPESVAEWARRQRWRVGAEAQTNA